MGNTITAPIIGCTFTEKNVLMPSLLKIAFSINSDSSLVLGSLINSALFVDLLIS